MEGVAFVACRMTVGMMDLEPADFIDGVVIQTAEAFFKQRSTARRCHTPDDRPEDMP